MSASPMERVEILLEEVNTRLQAMNGATALRRGIVRVLPPKGCLSCGHGKHGDACLDRDYWGGKCGCDRFIRRGFQGTRTETCRCGHGKAIHDPECWHQEGGEYACECTKFQRRS